MDRCPGTGHCRVECCCHVRRSQWPWSVIHSSNFHLCSYLFFVFYLSKKKNLPNFKYMCQHPSLWYFYDFSFAVKPFVFSSKSSFYFPPQIYNRCCHNLIQSLMSSNLTDNFFLSPFLSVPLWQWPRNQATTKFVRCFSGWVESLFFSEFVWIFIFRIDAE